MTTFNNDGLVHSVATQLTNHGNIYHGPVNNVHYANVAEALQLELTDPATKLDNDILASLAFPEMFTRRSNVTQAHPNTCEWILDSEQYKSWVSQPHGLFWVKGKPGAGKSTLMAFLYRRLEEKQPSDPGLSITFFFSARGAELERTPLGMLRSLLNQLFRQDSAVREHVRDFYRSMDRSFGHGSRSWEWQQVDLERLLQQSVTASARQQRLTIFVDALDEAGEVMARQVARYFHRLNDVNVSSSLPVKICISCRHYPITAIVPGTEISVENFNGADIASFVRDRLRTTYESMGDWSDNKSADSETTKIHDDLQDESPWVEFETYLISRARGIFQWVHLVVPMLEQFMLAGDSLQDIRQQLQKVPAELKDVYEHILRNIIDRKNHLQSFLLFQWVCLAARPLSVSEIRYALAASNAVILSETAEPYTENVIDTDERVAQRVKALSGGLAEAVAENPSEKTSESKPPKVGEWRVQIIHQSVSDFFITAGLGISASLASHSLLLSKVFDIENSTGKVIISQCQALLYRSCLKCLVVENLRRLDREDKTMLSYLYTADKPKHWSWICYAVDFMLTHAERAGEARHSDTKDQIKLMEEVIEFWIHASSRPDQKTAPRRPPIGTTVLHAASFANLLDIVEDIARLKENRSLNIRDSKGSTALHLAARQGHIKVIDTLVEAGADARVKNKILETPSLVAAYEGFIVCTARLLEATCDPDERALQTQQVLQAAAKSGHVKLVEYLLKNTANESVESQLLGNALQAAAHAGHERVTQVLLDAGADVHAQGEYMGDALQAASTGGTVRTLEMLLDAGANVNAQGGEYGNALQAALIMGNPKKVDLLLDAGADINAQGGKYGNAIQAALATGNLEKARKFLNMGVDVNASGGFYGNVLQAACCTGDDYMVQKLLDAGAEINARGGEYDTALQAAAAGGSIDVVRLLLEAGADVHAQGGRHGNALSAARESYNDRIVDLLLEASKKTSPLSSNHENMANDQWHKNSAGMRESGSSTAWSSGIWENNSTSRLSGATTLTTSDDRSMISRSSRRFALRPLSKLLSMTRQSKK